MGLATAIETAVTGLLNNYVTNTSSNLVNVLTPIAVAGLTIYLILMGLAIARGEVNDSIGTITVKFLKIAFICSLALTAGNYQNYVVQGITGIQGVFAGAFGQGAGTLGALIDNLSAPYETLDQTLWQQVGTVGIFNLPNLGLVCASFFVSIAEIALFAVALGTYVLALVSLALVLAVGPAFILCALFPATQRFTESWLGQALHFVFVNMLIGALIAMLTSIASQYATAVANGLGTNALMTDTVALLIVSFVMCIVMLNVNSIASALSGGASISGIGSAVAGYALGKFAGLGGAPAAKSGGSISNISGTPAARISGGTGGRDSATPGLAKSAGKVVGGMVGRPMYQNGVMENIQSADVQS